MDKRPKIFLSYSRKDSRCAKALDKAMNQLGLQVWHDVRSIVAGERWADSIEKGILDARAVVVLVTPSSADSHWVTYEYAFATGARIPGVAVVVQGAKVPSPVQRFQIVPFSRAKEVARKVAEGIREQSRTLGQERASAPKLVAMFQETNGALRPLSDNKVPAFWMDLWVEHAPRQTHRVSFEILDLGFKDRKWTVKRGKPGVGSLREFLTDDMYSYGDVEIWAKGIGPGIRSWSTISTLYEALVRYYRGRPMTTEVRRALRQIRDN